MNSWVEAWAGSLAHVSRAALYTTCTCAQRIECLSRRGALYHARFMRERPLQHTGRTRSGTCALGATLCRVYMSTYTSACQHRL